MGGRIAVHSELGRGSRFDIELSLPPAQRLLPMAPPLGHNVIYFEPHEASAEALAALLARLGCVAQRCRSAHELRHWMAHHGNDTIKPWLLAAVDAGETWGFLEASTSWLDGERMIGMGSAAIAAGTSANQRVSVPRTIVKPVLRAALVSRLGAVTRGLPRPQPMPLQTPAKAVVADHSKHVLVVEDDPTNQMIVCGMLHNAGYRTSTADNGFEALQALGQSVYDVVLMDWQMPGMDGLETTRVMRAGTAGRFAMVVPVIGLTANAFTEDRTACVAAGMNDYLTKPVLMASLLAAVDRWTARPGGDEISARSSAFAPLV